MLARIFIAILCLVFSLPAQAENQIEIGPGVCDTLVNHVPEPDATYQPGIDASGNPVVPADITPPVKLPEKIVVPITDYLASRLVANNGTPAQSNQAGAISPQVNLGAVTLENGQVSFNGQPISGDVDGELGALCRKARQQ